MNLGDELRHLVAIEGVQRGAVDVHVRRLHLPVETVTFLTQPIRANGLTSHIRFFSLP